tara:strand:+ start:649 stop:1539 length:891 start_codon:yes stop_codon:yes gene_type:complete
MSQLDLNSYESQISQLAENLKSKTDMSEAAFETKNKANEIVKTLGEAKTFISGKPVTKYLLNRAKAPVEAALEKAGVKLGEFKDQVTSTIRGRLNEAVENIRSRASSAVDNATGATTETQITDLASPHVLVGNNSMSRGSINGEDAPPAYDADGYSANRGEFQRPTAEPETGVQETSFDAEGASRVVPGPPAYEPPTAELPDVIATRTQAAANETVYATKAPMAPEFEEDAVKGVAKATEKDAVGDDAVTGVLDAIPGADIIGAALGIGLTVASILKKPKDHIPVDTINASFQSGI